MDGVAYTSSFFRVINMFRFACHVDPSSGAPLIWCPSCVDKL